MYTIKRNDLAEPFETTLEKNGEPMDLSGLKEILMHMVKVGGGAEVTDIVMDIAADQSGVGKGKISHRWEPGETAVDGVFEYEFEGILEEEDRPLSWPSQLPNPTLKFDIDIK